MPTIRTVLVFANGMVAVCDERGQQMPEYQGEWLDKRADILRDKQDSVEVQFQELVNAKDRWRSQGR